jgi:hypothetical protein
MGIAAAVVYAFGLLLMVDVKLRWPTVTSKLSQEYQSRPTDLAARNAISRKTYQELYRRH